MRERLLKQASHEYSPKQRAALLAAAGVLFLVILPWALVRLGGRLDHALDWPALRYPPVNAIAGGLLVLAGWLLGVWSNYLQFTLGRGTPVPVMATQKLIVRPPYSYCRNPMALGAIVAYLGVSVIAGIAGRGAAGAPGRGRAADLHQGRGGAGDGRALRGGVPGLSPPGAVHHAQAAQERMIFY